jgi:membrane protease subunit HflK
MPWQNDGGSGGPWGGGEGGDGGPRNPWGGGGDRGGGGGRRPPQGEGPRGGGPGGGPGGGGMPDFDEFIRRSQERLRASLPGGGGGGTRQDSGDRRPVWPWLVGGLALLWIAFTSTYRVEPQERGVVLRFGKYVATNGPGLHFKLPDPIDTVIKPRVEEVRSIDIGGSERTGENLMLTGDQNIIDVAYTVRWKISDPEDFLFQLADPETTVREVAESAMRAEMARVNLNAAIGPQRETIALQVGERAQELLNSYRAGIEVVGVDIRQADPPGAVDEAFKAVSAAQQEAQGFLNNARAYAQELIARAQGDTAVFDAVYQQYRLSPEVTRRRIYLETMEEVLRNNGKTVVEARGVTPYLPLPELQRRAAAAPTASSAAPSAAETAR